MISNHHPRRETARSVTTRSRNPLRPGETRSHLRSNAFAYGVAVAALDDPARTLAAGDDADVMSPHHDHADLRLARIAADRSPVAREPEIPVRNPQMLAEPPAAPCSGTTRMACIPSGTAVRERTAVMFVRAVTCRVDTALMVAARLRVG